MKQCPLCSSEHEDDTAACDCGYGFSGMGKSSDGTAAPYRAPRPDGGFVIGTGWFALAASALTGVMGWSTASSYDADLETAALLGSASWVFFYLFLVLWPT